MPPDSTGQPEIEKLEQRYAENSKGRVFAHLADAYRKAGDFAKAEGLILHGLKNHPEYISAYIVLGRVYLGSERMSDAHDQFSKVLELDGQNMIALKALGDLATRGGRSDHARSLYERMLQVDPRNVDAQEGLQRLEGDLGVSEPATSAEPVATSEEELGAAGPDDVTSPSVPPAAAGTGGEADQASGVAADETPPWEVESGAGADQASAERASESEARQELESGLVEGTDEVLQPAAPWERTAEPSAPDTATTEPLGSGGATDDSLDDPLSRPSLDSIKAGDPLFDTPTPPRGQEADLDFGEMQDWTPGFLRDEDMAGSGKGSLDAGSIVEELSEDISFEIDGDEPGPPVTPGRVETGDAGMLTETMAELYVEQGLFEDALRVYRLLAEARPGERAVLARIEEVERLAADAAGVAPVAPMAPAEPETEDAVAPPESIARPEPAELEIVDLGAGSADGDGFEFAVQAPAVGFAESDPFAASFDDLLGRPVEPTAPPGDVVAEAPAEEVEEAVPIQVKVRETPPRAPETAAPPAASELQAPSPSISARAAEDPQPSLAPTSESEPDTIETYLTSLLAFSPDVAAPGQSAESATSQPASSSDEGSEDLEEFQEWLRSLRR